MFDRHRTTFAASIRRPLIEDLEGRQLLSASLMPAAGLKGKGPAPAPVVLSKAVAAEPRLGTVVGTTDTTITITGKGKKGATTNTTYTVASGATITADGATVTLAQLVAGTNVKLKLDSSSRPSTVTSIVALDTEVHGHVTAVDPTAGTITISGKRGSAAVTYTVGTAPVTVDGAVATLADVTVGSDAELKLAALDPTKVLSVRTHTEDEQDDDGGGDHDGPHAARGVGGTVVDTTATSITVSNTADDGTTTQTTYNVSPTATITADSAAVTIDQLAAGTKVRLTLDPADATSVTAIKAVGTEVEGRLSAIDTTAGTITLAGKDGTAGLTYTIPSTATVKVDGVASSLTDALITVGSKVEIHFSALDPTKIIAVEIK
jgi:hypothetical protein